MVQLNWFQTAVQTMVQLIVRTDFSILILFINQLGNKSAILKTKIYENNSFQLIEAVGEALQIIFKR